MCGPYQFVFFRFLFVEPNVGKAQAAHPNCVHLIHKYIIFGKLKFEGHFVYLGEISEQLSLIRETDRDQPP